MEVWKYPLNAGETLITAPGPAEPLWAGLDPQGNPCVWLKVISSAPVQELSFLAVTDRQRLNSGDHVSSFIHARAMWHVFKAVGI